MTKIGVIGSEYFMEYTQKIQAACIFPQVQLFFHSDNGDAQSMNVASVMDYIEQTGIQALVIGPRDYAQLAAAGITIPCYIVHPSIQDFLLLHNSVGDYKSTAVIFSSQDDVDLTALEKCFNIQYHKYYYRNLSELTTLMTDLKKDGYTKVICNYRSCSVAKSMGIEPFYFYSQKCIEDGIHNALQMLRALERESHYISEVNSILENTTCGVVYASGNYADITYVNKTALDILHLRREDLIQKPLESLILAKMISRVTERQEAENNIQLSICGTDIIGNIVPFQIQEGTFHICLLFEKSSRILEYETMIRKEIKRKNFSVRYSFDHIIGQSDSLQKAVKQAKLFALSDSTILINAETGAGKEVFAQSIHNYSKRSKFPFVAINCGSIPDSLIESELFGYESGAFTGASSKGKRGLLESANHGTVFLDDVDALSQSFQSKLLRVMQEREIVRVGGNSLIPIDVRFIVASNRDLRKMVETGAFRNDLFYRINVLRLKISPLRDRPEDIPLLYEHYLRVFNHALFDRISPFYFEAFAPAFHYAHPGNIRELISIAERFSILADPSLAGDKRYIYEVLTDCIDADPSEALGSRSYAISICGDYHKDVRKAERTILEHYMKHNSGSISNLARRLGMSRATLYNKINCEE